MQFHYSCSTTTQYKAGDCLKLLTLIVGFYMGNDFKPHLETSILNKKFQNQNIKNKSEKHNSKPTRNKTLELRMLVRIYETRASKLIKALRYIY